MVGKWFLSGLMKSSSSSKKIFSEIYRDNYWGSTESRSGTGSTQEQTEVIRNELPGLVSELGIKSLLDAPCGDFNWLSKVPIDIDYVGIDIVPEIVKSNIKKYGSKSRTFVCADVTRSNLGRFDLILSRDFLVHLSLREALTALQAFVDSGSKYLLVTTFEQRESNRDILAGDWRPLNLRVAPFFLPAPLRLINEKCTEGAGLFADKSLGLWSLDSIGKALTGVSK